MSYTSNNATLLVLETSHYKTERVWSHPFHP